MSLLAIVMNRSGRPFASVTACCLVFGPPFVWPKRRPRLSLSPVCQENTPLKYFLVFRTFTRSLEAVRCALREVGSIITTFSQLPSEARPSHNRSKAPSSRQRLNRSRAATPPRFNRLQRVLGETKFPGASLHRNPLRLMRISPRNTRLSSTLRLPWLVDQNGRSKSICSSVSQRRLVIITPFGPDE